MAVKLKSLSEHWLQTDQVNNKTKDGAEDKIPEKYFQKEVTVKLFLYKLSSKIVTAVHDIDYNANEFKFEQYLTYLVNIFFEEENLFNHSDPNEVIALDKSLEEDLTDFVMTVLHFEQELITNTSDNQKLQLTAVDRSLIFAAFKALDTETLGDELREDIFNHFYDEYDASADKIEQILEKWKSIRGDYNDSFKTGIREIATIVQEIQLQGRQVVEKYEISDRIIKIQGTDYVEEYTNVIDKFLETVALETVGLFDPYTIFFEKIFLRFLLSHENPFRDKNPFQTSILVKKLLNIPQLLPILTVLTKCDHFRKKLNKGTISKMLERLLESKKLPLPLEMLEYVCLKQLWETMVTDDSIMDSEHICNLLISKEFGLKLLEIIENNLHWPNVSSTELKASKKYLETMIDAAIKKLYDKGQTFFERFRQVLHHDSGFLKLRLVNILLVKQQIELTDLFMIQAERLPNISLLEGQNIAQSTLVSCKAKIIGLLKRFNAVSNKPPIYYICLNDLAYACEKLGQWEEAERIYRDLFYQLTSYTLEDISLEHWKRVLGSKLYKEIQETNPTYGNLSKIAKDVAFASRQLGGKLFNSGKRFDNDEAEKMLEYFQKSIDIYVKVIGIEDELGNVYIRFTTKLMADLACTCGIALKICRQKHHRLQSTNEEMGYLLIQGDALVRALDLGEKHRDPKWDEVHKKNKTFLAHCICRMRLLLEGDSSNKLGEQIGKITEIIEKLEGIMVEC